MDWDSEKPCLEFNATEGVDSLANSSSQVENKGPSNLSPHVMYYYL